MLKASEMTSTKSAADLAPFVQPAGPRRSIVRLSERRGVNMAEQWFELVTLDHFWIVRRFDVLRRLCAHRLQPQLTYGEIGCGNGILQRQLADRFGLTADGIDLGWAALERNQSISGTLYYYDVLDRCLELREKYDVLFLFDVLEHVEEEDTFLQAILFHLKPGGTLIINVPSRQELYSQYDRAVGHVRRYRLKDLARLAVSHHLTPLECTYWGLPFYPLLLVRKLLTEWCDESSIVEKGMKPPGRPANRMLKIYARLELLPQRCLGTSIMIALQKPK